ncbi:MAG: hypothetical protein LBC69_00100 [Eubacteriaceae bacterium]|jgi:hypothetical protein|nr:hypothetical protein [Eubacteriaceae bacterium]
MASDDFDFKDRVDDVIKKSQEFTETVIKKAAEFAQSISEKAGQATGAAKKRLEIERQQSALYRKYRELGKAYYNKAKGAGAAVDVDNIIIEIDTIFATIDELEKEGPEAAEPTEE